MLKLLVVSMVLQASVVWAANSTPSNFDLKRISAHKGSPLDVRILKISARLTADDIQQARAESTN